LAGALIGALACFSFFFLVCNVLIPSWLGTDAFIVIVLAGAFAGAMTSFFGRKLPGPPDDRDCKDDTML